MAIDHGKIFEHELVDRLATLTVALIISLGLVYIISGGPTSHASSIEATGLGDVEGPNIYREHIWDGQNPTYLEGEETISFSREGNYSIRMNVEAIGGKADLSVSIDGQTMVEKDIDTFEEVLATPYREIGNQTTVRLEADCRPGCLHLEIREFEIVNQETQTEDLLYQPGKNWYRHLEDEDQIWSRGNSTVHLYNYGDRKVERTIWVVGSSFSHTRNMTYTLNDQELGTRVVPNKGYRLEFREDNQTTHPLQYPVDEEEFEGDIHHLENKYSFDVELRPGENILELDTYSDCEVKGEVNDNNDIRCTAFGLEDIYLTS